MRHSKHSRPEINTGSMADIAFLLLIFFLVTAVIPNDQGINRKLPRPCDDPDCTADIHQRNILNIIINKNDEVMVNEAVIELKDLKQKAIRFLDNNGDKTCDYCYGEKLSTSSDNPTKSIVSLQSNPQSSYEMFIKVQDEITAAYNELRTKFAIKTFGKSIDDLSKQELVKVKQAYPLIISEAITTTR